MIQWIEEEEAKFGPESTDQINFLVRRGEIYLKAGESFREFAVSDFNDAYNRATLEGDTAQATQILKKMTDLGIEKTEEWY